MTCRWNGRNEPRIVDDEGTPCPESHCRVCGRAHAEWTCAECVGAARDDLRTIAALCDSLPEEVEHRGVDGEAMTLLGPAADPEARGHLEASVLAGRVPADYLDHADGERHPLFVLGTWDMCWRDALEHDESDDRLTVASAADYLDTQLTYMAGFEHLPFEDFALDLRQCRAHLEAVLHDGEQRDTGAPCMTCNVPLERVWGDDEDSDGWKCPRCREQSSEAQYRFAVAHLHREEATWLTDRDMEIRTGVKAGTVREWARRGHVAKRSDSGRVVYAVEDVLRRAVGVGA